MLLCGLLLLLLAGLCGAPQAKVGDTIGGIPVMGDGTATAGSHPHAKRQRGAAPHETPPTTLRADWTVPRAHTRM
jgi:hypothetical protein